MVFVLEAKRSDLFQIQLTKRFDHINIKPYQSQVDYFGNKIP